MKVCLWKQKYVIYRLREDTNHNSASVCRCACLHVFFFSSSFLFNVICCLIFGVSGLCIKDVFYKKSILFRCEKYKACLYFDLFCVLFYFCWLVSLCMFHLFFFNRLPRKLSVFLYVKVYMNQHFFRWQITKSKEKICPAYSAEYELP